MSKKQTEIAQPQMQENSQTEQGSSSGEPRAKFNNTVIYAVVFGVIGLMAAGIICGALAIAFSVSGLRQIAESKMKGKVLGVIGICLGAADIIYWGITLMKLY